MKQELDVCIDQDLYVREMPGSSFQEARAVVLGMYLEKEAGTELEKKIKEHLEHCKCCIQFFESLEQAGEFPFKQDLIPRAVCPSGSSLDAYLFDPASLSGEQKRRLDLHLQECPLCKEETDWLRNLEQEKVIAFPTAGKNWVVSLSAVAAVCFLILSAILWWKGFHTKVPEEQLRALAVIKQPEQIDFAGLDLTSESLPFAVNPLYQQAKGLLKQHQFQEAAQNLEKVLQSQPDHSASMYLLGYCYYYLNEPEKAFALCDRAERIEPHAMERCLSLVNIALKTGHFARAFSEIHGLYHEAPEVPEIRDMYDRITALTRGRTLKL